MRDSAAARAVCATLLALTACASTEQTRSMEISGFLKDYTELAQGRGDQAQLLFIDQAADFSGYERVMIDPVTVWTREGSDLEYAPLEELQQLADSLETMLRQQVGLDFDLVSQPRAGTLRIRTAITEAQKSKVVLDIVSKVLPPAIITGAIGRLATGTYAFVGRAAVEMEVLDAISGKRLIAAADERAGTKSLRGSTDEWSDVHDAFEHWADAVRAALSTLRRFDIAEARVDAGAEEGEAEVPAEASD